MAIFPAFGNAIGFPLLSIIIGVPGVAAMLCLLIDDDELAKRIAAIFAILNVVLGAILLVDFKITDVAGASGWLFQFSDTRDWVSSLGISYWLGVDGIGVFLVALTTVVMAVAILAGTFMIAERIRIFLAFMLFLEAAVLGVFMAANLFLFFVFWEAMLIPMYFLIGLWGEERRVYATTKFVVYTVFGSFFMLVAIFYLWSHGQPKTLDMPGQNGLIAQLSAHPLSSSEQTWLFLAFAIAFAIKLPIWPFHTWAPTAYTESPIPVVIALSGILSKAGAFGFLRYSLPLFPQASRDLAAMMSVLCIVGMLYAAGLALVQTDIKKLVAYASISHVNLIGLGIFSLNSTGLDGSVLQIVNHSVIITGLFLAVAYIAARSGSRLIQDMGGMGARLPVLMWLFFVFVLAGLDLPGLNSFAGEFLILTGVFKQNAWFSSIAALTVVLAAWYMIRLFQDTMNGPRTASPQGVSMPSSTSGGSFDEHGGQTTPYQYPVVNRLSGDLKLREVALFVPLLALIIYIGVQPDTLTRRINPTTTQLSRLVTGIPTASHVGGGR